MQNLLKFYLAVLISLIAGSVSFAVAYSNLEPTDPRGNGNGEISGWTASDIHYNLAQDPALIQSVEFNLGAPAGEVRVRLSTADPAYFRCINTNQNHWRCEVEGVSVASLTDLRVIATGGQ